MQPANISVKTGLEMVGSRFEKLHPREQETYMYVFGAMGIDSRNSTLLDFEMDGLARPSSSRMLLQTSNGAEVAVWAETIVLPASQNTPKRGFMCSCTNPQAKKNSPKQVTFYGTLTTDLQKIELAWGSVYFDAPGMRGDQAIPQIYLNKKLLATGAGARITNLDGKCFPIPEALLCSTPDNVCEAFFGVAKVLLGHD